MSGIYDLHYEDPPWWMNRRKRTDKLRGGVWGLYPPMRDAELLAMRDQVREWTARSCASFMWATGPRMDFATVLLKAWGFRYVGVQFVWVKTDNLQRWAHYHVPRCEFVLFGARGRLPEPAFKPPQVIYEAPRAPHEKPAIVRTYLERMWPGFSRLELFARHNVPGWTPWGNQVGILDRASGEVERSIACQS